MTLTCTSCEKEPVFDDLVAEGDECQRWFLAGRSDIETEPDIAGSTPCGGYYYPPESE